MTEYEEVLLLGWEDTYKKSQLTLWLLLAIKDSPKKMAEIKEFIKDRTNDTISADDKSMYRALRRLAEADLIESTSVKSFAGPNSKLFELTEIGQNVLSRFVDRNIASVLLKKDNKDLF